MKDKDRIGVTVQGATGVERGFKVLEGRHTHVYNDPKGNQKRPDQKGGRKVLRSSQSTVPFYTFFSWMLGN